MSREWQTGSGNPIVAAIHDCTQSIHTHAWSYHCPLQSSSIDLALPRIPHPLPFCRALHTVLHYEGRAFLQAIEIRLTAEVQGIVRHTSPKWQSPISSLL